MTQLAIGGLLPSSIEHTVSYRVTNGVGFSTAGEVESVCQAEDCVGGIGCWWFVV